MTTVGTNEWMAPEVAMQDPYDKSADVFSYAMVLYELLTREKPPPRKLKDAYAWDAAKMKQTIPEVYSGSLAQALNERSPVSLSPCWSKRKQDAPESLWKLLCDCASFEPPKRPQFKDVAKQLKALLETMPKDDGDADHDTDAAIEETEGLGNKDSDSSEDEDEEETIETTRCAEPVTWPERSRPTTNIRTHSYIARGQEITEITKTIKRAFRKPDFVHIQCAIPKKPAWRAGADLFITCKALPPSSGDWMTHVFASSENQQPVFQGFEELSNICAGNSPKQQKEQGHSHQASFGGRWHLPRQGQQPNREEYDLFHAIFPTRGLTVLVLIPNPDVQFTIPASITESTDELKHDLALEFILKATFGSTHLKAFLPLNIIKGRNWLTHTASGAKLTMYVNHEQQTAPPCAVSNSNKQNLRFAL